MSSAHHCLQRRLAWFQRRHDAGWPSVLWAAHWWPWRSSEGQRLGSVWQAWRTGRVGNLRGRRPASPACPWPCSPSTTSRTPPSGSSGTTKGGKILLDCVHSTISLQNNLEQHVELYNPEPSTSQKVKTGRKKPFFYIFITLCMLKVSRIINLNNISEKVRNGRISLFLLDCVRLTVSCEISLTTYQSI